MNGTIFSAKLAILFNPPKMIKAVIIIKIIPNIKQIPDTPHTVKSEIQPKNTSLTLRTALLTASEKVILVHNHPSNTLKASFEDKHITNVINKFLNIFSIQLLDHIIVAENGYLSMGKENEINRDYKNDDIRFIENTFVIEENTRLKKELQNLNSKTFDATLSDMEDDMEF